ncbi:hypothetical protein AZI86_03930 [Bdellovibrio bacteriovorus]|uniref:Uncharacterized protein n=1 Tax=Bdellovibrio bacteriovorus TaxID=959 RepID=A0A150WP70_BDEBC|nr:hypothetical protein [Bdellovibrio bacteriovorus]KYG66220.1 hypothetical protein AZI86_03930 [Bdellovibrio bacteriovorus]
MKFRLVILDYPKEQLDRPVAQKILSDTVFAKQKNFLRTEPNYVVTDKHDMIGTHYLIYDTTEFLDPKLIFAIRTTFLSRAEKHRLDTPLLGLIPRMEESLQNSFNSFRKRHTELVDCNAWFVDVNYSKKNSGLNLSDLGYFMVCMNVLRSGCDNIVGCTNETYNASRWLEKLGDSEKGLIFEHPVIKTPHMMLMVENFNLQHFYQVYQTYKELLDDTYEIFPESGRPAQSLTAFVNELFARHLKGPATSDAA